MPTIAPKTLQSPSLLRQMYRRTSRILFFSTMAALYTLNLHATSPHQIRPARLPAPPLRTRIARAAGSQESMLRIWRTDICNAVGFEVLAPALLDLLAMQGQTFDFPDRAKLLNIRADKIQRVQPAMLYNTAPAALLHSLEAFHGWKAEDFDVRKVKHHLVRGSMMATRPQRPYKYGESEARVPMDRNGHLRIELPRGSLCRSSDVNER